MLVFAAFLSYLIFTVLNGLFDDRIYADALVESEGRGGLVLEDQARVNLLTRATGAASSSSDEAELRGEMGRLRNFRPSLERGRLISILAVAAGALIMGLLYLPSPVSYLRWPGLTLLLTGAATFALSWLILLGLAELADVRIRQTAEFELVLPPAAVNLTSEALRSILQGLLDNIRNQALLLAWAGAILCAVSYALARRREPWRKNPAHPGND